MKTINKITVAILNVALFIFIASLYLAFEMFHRLKKGS